MTSRPAERRAGLTRDEIVVAAIELLDASGEGGLTFRALAARLRTGHGAIQWHVTTKRELLTAATVATLARALEESPSEAGPRETVRGIGLAVFTEIEAHPWLGAQLFAAPWESPMVRLWERLARPVTELGVPADALFAAVSTLVNYIVGVGGQNAANQQLVTPGADRSAFLRRVADDWERHDPTEGSLIRRLAAQLRIHDDREDFLAGIDTIVAGLGGSARTGATAQGARTEP